MSDLPTGPGSWQASDGKWYPPQGPPGIPLSPPDLPVPPTRNKAGFGVGVLVGLLAGVLIGGLAAALIGLQVGGDDSSTKIGLGGADQSVNSQPDQPRTAPDPVTTREEPAPVGTPVSLGNGWSISITSFDPAFTPDPDSLGNPPPEGQQFVVVGVKASYDGVKDAESPFFGMDLSMVGSSGVERSTTSSNCFAPDPQFGSLDDVYKGGSAMGNLCIAVDASEVDSLVFVAEPGATFDAQKSYLALR